MSLSSDATDLIREAALAEAADASAPGVRVGFVLPKVIYDRIRALDAKVSSLGRDISANLPADRPFVFSWISWTKGWEQFRDSKLAAAGSWDPRRTVPGLFDTDATNAQVDQYQRDLNQWYAEYAKQPSATDPTKPVPAPTAPSPTSPAPSSSEPSWWDRINPLKKGGVGITDIVPWWVWAIGIAGAVGVGYSIYKTSTKVRAQAVENEALLRGLAMRQMGVSGEMPARDVPTIIVNAAPASTGGS